MRRMKGATALMALLLFAAGCGKQAEMPAPAATSEPTAAAVTEVVSEEVVLLASPTPTVIPVPTEEPTPTPTATPEPFVFTASEALPLPNPEDKLQKGRPYHLDGVVSAASPLTDVTVTVRHADGKPVGAYKKSFDAADGVTEYRLLDPTFSNDIECLSEAVPFDKLDTGDYTLTLSASSLSALDVVLAECRFTVVNTSWIQLIPNNFRLNYPYALAFFGSEERFLFRYRVTDGRHITTDDTWRTTYMSSAKAINGKTWRCHIDAVPYFEKACAYLESTYVRVHGKNGDTGALQLSRIVELDGTYVPRFVSGNAFVSHHSFGTAADINVGMSYNSNRLSNREAIYQEVHDALVYNGVTEVKGKRCYDFTYSGSCRARTHGVPDSIANYLIYELAFFRAGFGWGLYYPHTSDAMHFSLTELDPALFESSDYALRKVFSYNAD